MKNTIKKIKIILLNSKYTLENTKNLIINSRNKKNALSI